MLTLGRRYCGAHSMTETRSSDTGTIDRSAGRRVPRACAIPGVLLAAGHRQHIEIAEEAFFKIGISAVDHVRQYEFHNEDASIMRQ